MAKTTVKGRPKAPSQINTKISGKDEPTQYSQQSRIMRLRRKAALPVAVLGALFGALIALSLVAAIAVLGAPFSIAYALVFFGVILIMNYFAIGYLLSER